MRRPADSKATGSDGEAPRLAFRPDIEGLRAIAVLAVLGYHAGVPWMAGGYVGVDVFFVISGFLITGILISQAEATGSVRLADFYAKRARRLLPASALVLAFVAALTVFILPMNRWDSISKDLLASATYLANWRFAQRSVEYLAADDAASPVQHFWSLAIEEQFYFVWPFVIAIGAAVARWLDRSVRAVVSVPILVVFATSLQQSITLTERAAGQAYFVTHTRLWEMAAGAILALVSGRLPTPSRRTSTSASLLGASAVAAPIAIYSGTTDFPGVAALLPVAGTILLIFSGAGAADHLLLRTLAHPAAQWIGARSYSLYLWHWPLVVATSAQVSSMNVWWGLSAVLLSFGPAEASYRLVERPIRQASALRRPWLTVPVAALFTLVGLASAAATTVAVRSQIDAEVKIMPELASPVLTVDRIPSELPDDLTPSLVRVADDRPTLYALGCHVEFDRAEAKTCEFGDPSGPTVVLIGDSHAAQWAPALQEIAELRGWRLLALTKSACPFSAATHEHPERGSGPYVECSQWNDAAVELILDEEPALVVTTSRINLQVLDGGGLIPEPDAAHRIAVDGISQQISMLAADGIQVVRLRDTPMHSSSVPDCVARLGVNNCATAPTADPIFNDLSAESFDPPLGLVDLTPWICTDTTCPAVRDSILIWRDSQHVTTSLAKSLATSLFLELQRLLPASLMTTAPVDPPSIPPGD